MRKFKVTVAWAKFRGERLVQGQEIDVDYDALGGHDKASLHLFTEEVEAKEAEVVVPKSESTPKKKGGSGKKRGRAKKPQPMKKPAVAVVDSEPIELPKEELDAEDKPEESALADEPGDSEDEDSNGSQAKTNSKQED